MSSLLLLFYFSLKHLSLHEITCLFGSFFMVCLFHKNVRFTKAETLLCLAHSKCLHFSGLPNQITSPNLRGVSWGAGVPTASSTEVKWWHSWDLFWICLMPSSTWSFLGSQALHTIFKGSLSLGTPKKKLVQSSAISSKTSSILSPPASLFFKLFSLILQVTEICRFLLPPRAGL